MAPEKESNGLDNYTFALEGRFSDLPETKHGDEDSDTSMDEEGSKWAYCVTDVPPWYLCILLGIQHCLTAFGGIIAIPLILSQGLCLQHDGLTQSHLISTIFFVSGICTLLQVTFGIRTTALIIVFSQYLRHIPVSFPTFSKDKKLHSRRVYIFQILPVLLGISLSWLLCYILTVVSVLPSDPGQYGYLARTDLKGDIVGKAPWVTLPYPGQWGLPTVSVAGVLGIFAGVISSMIESVGDYHACARLSGAPPPPKHAINRGIGIEGLGCLLAGAWGTGNGTTSYSENVGALGITKVGSRTVIFAGSIFMIAMGVFGKVGAIFATIPSPVIGGMFMVMFGVISAAGISNLQYSDLNSSRNIFVFGFSMFSGLVIPNWVIKNPTAISTGVAEADQVLQVLLTTSMFVGGFFGFLLDNTIPGTKQERGILAWNKAHEDSSINTPDSGEVYDLPFGLSAYLSSFPWSRYLPFCPPFVPKVLDGCGDDNTTREPKKALGHSEPSQISIGIAL
ncbi:xan_ur_permease domain-containing protein isoform X2 [Phyllopteryx taeniolatus]|uniref:xan_ur_permease domain-containing protein isoform X2 n=1 Tax=Phyllopteryx taeniolatus TaxID=161469 RepID=UPI002AD28CC1|nr:xan_ur_permease domain-containing protein isoform X2 [Phyllopteryx taeniolatus]